ncbi:MAG: FAD-dependent oxidoreductase [Alphaproteobacteria bacterium]|nr:FAD-dependent oxidoreductase [Alphaproteobacteria bacterium]
MRSHARVVVIGGGIAGCSTLYHLTQEGWDDVMLVERDELTSGSTWHAAAQVTQFGGNQTMVALKRHSIDLYRELAADEDFPINYHITGGMRLGYTERQEDIYKHYIGMAKGMGIEFELIDGEEAARRHPLMKSDGIRCAWWDPLDGDIDPSQLTQALARRARQAGAEVVRFNPVEGLTQKPNGEWIVHTKQGDITAEYIVNATGYRVNEVGQMMGVTHPVISMEHMYFLTDPIQQLEEMESRVPIIRDPGDDFYSRQEKKGLLVGVYEQGCKTFGMDGIDPDFTMALCPNDLDRCLDNMERIFERMPALTETGIHTVVNGPITYSADGSPLVGRIPGVRNAFACLGLRAGIGEGGGHGKILAETIVHGESEWDAWFLDPRRFTQHANTNFTMLKSIEDYQMEFHYHEPHEFRPAGRLARTTPLYPVLKDLNAEFGVVNGWERALFYPPQGFEDEPGYRFHADREAIVKAEVENVRDNVGIMEVSGFTRFAVKGANAHAAMDRLIAGRMPKPGKVTLSYLLTEKGNVLSEATIANLADDTLWYGSAAASEWHDLDWLNDHLGDDVEVINLSASHTTMVIAGPRTRDLLADVAPQEDWSHKGFPFMSARSVLIGHAEAVAMRISYSGELAFEFHVPNEQLYLFWTLMMAAGAPHGLKPFGLNATESMRLEKGYRHWKADLMVEFNPLESGLERFITREKTDYIGRDGFEAMIQQGMRKVFVMMEVEADHAPAHGGDGIYLDGVQVGSVTSGGYGHRVGKNIAYGFIDPDVPQDAGLTIEILAEFCPARVFTDALYDPENIRVRSA